MPLTNVTPTQSQTATIILAFAAGVAVGANWPKIRKSLGPVMAVAGDKFGDVYSAIAQAIGEQKEALEDSRAERRQRSRSKTAAAGNEQELLSTLAAALLKGKGRATAKRTRKRAAPRSRKSPAGGTQGSPNGAPETRQPRTMAE